MQIETVARSLSALFVLSLASRTGAQQVLFFDDFESGLGQWTTTGIWGVQSETDPCGAQVAPFPSSSHAAWYGKPASCNFEPEWDKSWLTLNTPIDIPVWADQVDLDFWSFEDAECSSCEWDWRFVYVSPDAGQTWWFVGEGTQLLTWYEKTIDISNYRGKSILVRFEFDPVDTFANNFLGWFVDDVSIRIQGCVEPTNYCVGAQNSVGSGAVMAGRGVPSISQNYFKVTADFAPPGQFGLFYYGPVPVQTPFGDGYRCVGAGSSGTFRLNPPVVIDATGFAHRLLDFTQPPEGSGPGKIEVGSTWYFQFWYRDPAFGGSGFNLSNGLEVVFCP
jgi:hypothetical protein